MFMELKNVNKKNLKNTQNQWEIQKQKKAREDDERRQQERITREKKRQ